MKEKIVILFGGMSAEHDISIITAIQTMKFLPGEYSFLPVYIAKDGKWWTAENMNDVKTFHDFQKYAKKKKRVSFALGENQLLVKRGGRFVPFCKVSAVLNCCHGRIGEDGCVQGVFECCDVAQTSCGVTSSAICMDKAFMKDIFEANNIPSPLYLRLHKCEYEKLKDEKLKEIEKRLDFPLIVKPANLGSSIGISICNDLGELEDALQLAFEFDSKVVVEEVVGNLREFNCACFSYREEVICSSVNEVKDKTDIFTFEDKYLSNHSKNKEADKGLSKKVARLAEKVYRLFDCKGVVRVDFLYDEKDKFLYVNEINSIPGSLAFYLFKGTPFKELLRGLIEESFANHDNERRLITTFDSDALKIFEEAGNSGKK